MSHELEDEFEKLCQTIGKEIVEQVEIANKALNKAMKLSEKHGIPFYSAVSQIDQPYVPDSYEEKFSFLNKKVTAGLTDVSSYDLGRKGWKHSQCC